MSSNRWVRPMAGLAAAVAAAVLGACTIDDLPMRKSIETLGYAWKQVAAFAGDSTDPLAEYGRSTAICGSWAAVGCPAEGASGEGAVYLYQRTGGTWRFAQKITGGAGAFLGTSVALSNTFLAVGAPGETTGAAGAVYVYALGNWSSSKRLISLDHASGDQFGYSVAVSDSWVLAGAPYHGASPAASGQAYIFARDQGGPANWGSPSSHQSPFHTAAPAANDYFGASVSLSGNYAVVGAPNGFGSSSSGAGAAYVYWLNGATWGDGAGGPTTTLTSAGSKAFGISVALSGDWILVGSSGNESASLYNRSGTGWSGTPLSDPNGTVGNLFGFAVGLSGNLPLVGAVNHNGAASLGGRIFPFELIGSSIINEDPLYAQPAAANAGFGQSISVSGDSAIVGAFGNDTVTGMAFILERSR